MHPNFSFIALVAGTLLSLASTSTTADCIFDNADFQASIANDMAKPIPINGNHADRLSGWAKLRLQFSTEDLYNPSQYCTAAGDVRSDFMGGTITCGADDVFTDAKRDQLVNTVLPYAQATLQNAFQVQSLTSPLKVGSRFQCSGGFTIPMTHVTDGVPNADYILYVAAGPTVTNNIAWAGGCQSTSNSPARNIVGRANFGPAYLDSDALPLEDVLHTGVHEMLHALGYAFPSFQAAGITQSMVVRGRTKNVITSLTATQKAREYVGCFAMAGVELEDEGGAGSADSHPDRRIWKGDIMAATSGTALSIVTLAVMEDLGVYIANFSAAVNMITGKYGGCGYALGDCDTTAGGLGHWWCEDDGAIGCTSELDGYGPCRTGADALFTDGCGYFAPYSNRHCYDVSQANNPDTGDTFSDTSRCVITNGFRATGSGGSSIDARCLNAQCISGQILSFNVNGGSARATCTVSGASVTLSGFDGVIICPNISEMCDSLNKNVVQTPAGPLPPAVPVPTGTANPASDYIYTVRVTLFITGTGWDVVVRNRFSDLSASIRLDVAQLLALQSQQVWLRQVATGLNYISFLVTINDPSRDAGSIGAIFQSAIESGGRNWMPRTANLYIAASGQSDTPVLGSASAEPKPDNVCVKTWPNIEDSGTCTGIIIGITAGSIVVLIIIAVVVYLVWFRQRRPQTRSRPTR